MRWSGLAALMLLGMLGAVSCALEAAPQEREVVGVGATRQEAVSNGLVEGLRQIAGLAIDSRQQHEEFRQEWQKTFGGVSFDATEFNDRQQGQISLKTAGVVESYRILSIDHAEDGLYRATLLVRVERYETPGISPQNRRALAVLPFRTLQQRYSIGGVTVAANELSRRLAQQLVSEFTQSRRFSVMDRDYADEYLREKNLILGPDAAVGEYAKLGQALGVDYLVVGTITDAGTRAESREVEVLGERYTRYNGRLRAEYRIVVMATRQIKWSSSVDISFGDSDIRRALGAGSDATAVRDRLIARAAAGIAQQALNNIYPIRIAKVRRNGELVLNQGGITVKEDEEFDVFGEGEEIIDPYTGEPLGHEEELLGRARITRVNPKTSIATLIAGDVRAVPEGAILRKAERRAAQGAEKTKGTPRQVYQPGF